MAFAEQMRPYSSLRWPLICLGDHLFLSFSVTKRVRNASSATLRQSCFDRQRVAYALWSAFCAAYTPYTEFFSTSRDMVLGLLPSTSAISRIPICVPSSFSMTNRSSALMCVYFFIQNGFAANASILSYFKGSWGSLKPRRKPVNSSLEKDHNVIVRKDKRFDMLAVALQLHRAESGGWILYRQPSSQWFADMRTVSKSTLGNITLVMHPTIGGDFDGDHGVMIALVPGNLEGTVGGHGESFEEKRREIRYISELCNYGRRSRLGLN